METATRCPACRARIAANVAVCPACGARLKRSKKAATSEGSREAPADPRLKQPKKKKRKQERSGPNYPLIGAIGGGVVVAGILVWMVIVGVQQFRKPVVDVVDRADPNNPAGGPNQPVVPAGPVWTARADPPKAPVRPKDDLSIPVEGEPVFASGHSPFVVDLVAGPRVGDLLVISVYDVRSGERSRVAKANWKGQTPGQPAVEDPTRPLAALGPDGNTLAARLTTETGTGRKRQVTNEVLVYRFGQDAPVARIPVAPWVRWMEFGRDEDQLIVVAAPPNSGISAAVHDLKNKDASQMGLQLSGTWVRWRDGFHPEALAISPGRNYIAVGGARSVDLIQLSDGKPAGTLTLPGDCVSVAFSPDGKELAVHSMIPPPRRTSKDFTQYQWTTFSLADGKQLTQEQVTGGPVPGPILAAGPKPGLAVHGDRKQVLVTDTRLNAPVCSTPFPAVRCFESDRLLGYDAKEKRVTVRRIDAEQLAAGEKVLAEIFGPRPAAELADRTAVSKPGVPAAWAVPIDAAPDAPAMVDSHTISGGADFVMPWAGRSALSAVVPRRVETPRARYALQWHRVDLTTGKGDEPIELWPSMLPPGQVPALAGSGAVVADQTADGSWLALRDAADPTRIDIWDRSGKRLTGFLPFGKDTPVDVLVWANDNRLITMAAGRVTGWEIPSRKAVFELTGYAGAYAVSPGRRWIALQTAKFIDVYETATGKPLGRLPHANSADKPWHAFAVTRDATALAAVELVRTGQNGIPGIWAYVTWDLKTGMKTDADRIFAGFGNRAHHVQWVAPRQLLAGGTDVIDLDARAVTATLTLHPPMPLPSPDGRYWGAQGNQPQFVANQPRATDFIGATNLDSMLKAVPRPAAAEIVLRDGVAVEVVSNTGNASRDAVIRSTIKRVLADEGYRTDGPGWRIVVTGQRTAGTGASLETPSGDKIRIPGVSGKIQLLDPVERVAWETPHSGGWDMQNTKYKTHTTKEGTPGLGGSSTTHYNFGGRDPQDAMADEAWESFVQGVGNPRFPRVMAKINDKLVQLPVTVPAGK